MRELCGNTEAEINRDRTNIINIEDWQMRQEERERKLNARREFIQTLLNNETYYQVVSIDGIGNHHKQPWFMSDAISNIDDETFWNFVIPDQELSINELFEQDSEYVSGLFSSGKLDQFKILLHHEVENLADMLDGKL